MIELNLLLEIGLTGLISAIVGFVWVWVLTEPHDLLHGIVKYYPNPQNIIGYILRCSICLGGWLSLCFTPYYSYYLLYGILYTIKIALATVFIALFIGHVMFKKLV